MPHSFPTRRSSDLIELRPFQEMDAFFGVWIAALPHFLSGEGDDRRGIADQRVEQRVEHRAIGAALGVGLRVAIEAVLADVEEEGRQVAVDEIEQDRKSTRLNSSH